MDILIILLVMMVLLLLKGFFSGSEIALVNSDKPKWRYRRKQGNRGAKRQNLLGCPRTVSAGVRS